MAPFYDYCCKGCDTVFEVRHAISDKPIVVCPQCQSKDTRKVISACAIIVKNSTNRRVKDHMSRSSDIMNDLKENYGIEKVAPLGGSTIEEVYKDVKATGGMVRDDMQRQKEETARVTTAKQREWTKAALKRAPKRQREMAQRKAAEESARRRINL